MYSAYWSLLIVTWVCVIRGEEQLLMEVMKSLKCFECLHFQVIAILEWIFAVRAVKEFLTAKESRFNAKLCFSLTWETTLLISLSMQKILSRRSWFMHFKSSTPTFKNCKTSSFSFVYRSLVYCFLCSQGLQN